MVKPSVNMRSIDVLTFARGLRNPQFVAIQRTILEEALSCRASVFNKLPSLKEPPQL